MSVTRPPLVFVAGAGQHLKRVAKTLLAIENSGIVPTAVLPSQMPGEDPRNILIRFYESTGHGGSSLLAIRSSEKVMHLPIFDLGGREIAALKPWLIGEAKIALRS